MAAGMEPTALRVATLNVWCRHGDWDARRRVLADGFRALAPDLVTLQETYDDDQVPELLGPGYQVVHHGGRAPDRSGSSIASRWPVEDLREIGLAVTPRVEPDSWIGRLVLAEIGTPAGRVLLAHHKPSWQLPYEHERELQAAAAARAIEEHLGGRDLHVILAGDFDATPDAASIRFWRGRQALGDVSVSYRDAWEHVNGDAPGHTFTPDNPLVANGEMPLGRGRRIDYVMVRCGDHGPALDIARCERIFDQPVAGVWGSDHFGVMADLRRAP
jgi:endonuclease/exonuclease/phosphatase family metal-dependent hydrolase